MARTPQVSNGHTEYDDGSSTVARWHAVEIRGGRRCCEAVRALAGKRFLPGETPTLPLPDCDCRARCQCRYRHHEDRRCGPRRAADGAFSSPPAGNGSERRLGEGRREQDHEAPLWEEEQAAPSTSTLDDTYYEYVRNSKLFE